jgi:hypothetical protein
MYDEKNANATRQLLSDFSSSNVVIMNRADKGSFPA